MTHVTFSKSIKIGITSTDNVNHLVMMIARGSGFEAHHLTLAQARAMSLEIVKQVYQAEMRNNMRHAHSSSRFAFQMSGRLPG